LKSVQRFQRRRVKCEKLTDGRTTTHDKSSHGLWPGELKTGFPWRKIISLCKLVSDLCPIDILTGEIAVEVIGVVGVNPALCYFRYIASIFLTLHKCLCLTQACLSLITWTVHYLMNLLITD
jgi:hypothetical protein